MATFGDEEVVERGVEDDRRRQPGKTARRSSRRVAVGQRLGDDRGDGGDAAVHDRGPETANTHSGDVGVVEHREVVDVFERGETRADRESADGGIDEEPDPAVDHQRRRSAPLRISSTTGAT